MIFLKCGPTNMRAIVFTCANSWNDRRRASCTMQNLPSIPCTEFLDLQREPQSRTLRQAPKCSQPTIILKPIIDQPQMEITNSTHTHHAHRWRSVFCTVIFLCSSHLVGTAWAQASQTGKPKTTQAPQQQKRGGLKVIPHKSPSEETQAERDRRLYRECKGMPNAGACLGYTRR